MTLAEAIETTCIHRVAGLTGARTALVTTRPCRAPPQTISAVGLIGGGHLPRPGEGSRAHHGVLFLDELSECRRHILEILRQPLEEGFIYSDFHLDVWCMCMGSACPPRKTGIGPIHLLGNRSRYNLPGVLDLAIVIALVERL
jgi:hypothetical protein